MKLVFRCPSCQSPNISRINSDATAPVCHACNWTRAVPPEHLDGERPNCCLICGNSDLWRQKDFPQGLGLLFVVVGAVVSTIFWAQSMPVASISTLLVFAALDMILFVTMKDVLVCYRCQSRHRQADIDDDHPRFDLELAERYRQESIRLAEAEQRTGQIADDD